MPCHAAQAAAGMCCFASLCAGTGEKLATYDEMPRAAVDDAIIPVGGEAEAIATANDSVFELGAAVITSDLARGERVAAELLEAGCVFVNDAVRSDPRLPFGGVKESGYGRELSGYGIKEFVNIKAVLMA